MIVPMLPVLLAMIMLAGSKKAEAFDVGVSIGGGHHYRGGTVIQYRTSDPVYSTWYPESSSSYVYVPTYSSSYYGNGYGYRYGNGYSNSSYIYSTNSGDYNGWYGGGRSGHGGYYGRGYRR
jgi:hypothetical protein